MIKNQRIKLTKCHRKNTNWFLPLFTALFTLVFLLNTVQVSAQNCTVNADVDQNICVNNTLTLTGSKAGLIAGPTSWSQVSGPTAVITSPELLVSTVTGISPGNIYKFRLSTTCVDGSRIYDEVLITVRSISVANAGADLTVCPASPTGILTANAPGVNETGTWSGSGSGISVVSATSASSNINAAGTSAGTANLTWTITNSNGCSSSDVVAITNQGGVSPVNAGSDKLASAIPCYSSTASVTMAASFGGSNIGGQQGTWTVISGPNMPTIANVNSNTTTVSNLIQGTYTMRWTVSGSCVNGFDEMTITIPPPTATLTTIASGNQIFCDNRNSAILTATTPLYAGETVSWTYVSGPAGSVIASPASPSTTVTGLNGVSGSTYRYRYTITNSFGCTANVTTNITFANSSASLSIVGGNTIAACNANTVGVSYTVIGGTQTQWRLLSGPGLASPGAWNNVAASPANITGLNNIGTYVVQFQRLVSNATNTCPPVTAQINITTSKSPTASNAGSRQVLACNVTSTALAGNVPVSGTGTWYQVSGPNIANLTNPLLANTTVSGLINGLYVFKWLINGGPACPINQGLTKVLVASVVPSTAAAGPDLTVCFNTPVSMAASIPVLNETGTWTASPPTGVAISNVNDPKAIVTFPNPNTAYTLTWTIVNGCGTSSDAAIFTTSSNQGPVQSIAGTDQCQPAGTTMITLVGNNPSPGTGTWTKLTGGSATITAPTSLNSTVTGMSNGIYTFQWAISYGTCAVSRDTVMITVSAPVTVSNAGSDQTLCAGSTGFAANTPVVGSGMWSEVTAPTGYSIANLNSPTSSVSGLVEGVYTFTWTVSYGSCPSSSDDVIFNVSSPPSVAVAGSGQSLCGVASATLAATAPSYGSGTWSVISGPNIPAITSISSPISGVTGLIQGTYILRWTITAGPFCPPDADDVIITVVPLANANTNQNLCGLTSTELTGNTGSTGTWLQVGSTPNVAAIAPSGSNTALVSGLIAGVYTFQYSIAANGGCAATTDNVTVTVSGLANTADAGTDQEICRPGASVTITLNGNTPVMGIGTWTRLSGSGGTTFLPNANTPAATISTTTPGVSVYVWTVTNGSCSVADQVRINVFASPSISSAGAAQAQVCGTSTTMAANAPAAGVGAWSQVSGPNTASITSTIMPNTTITNLVAGTYVFQWTISNGPCATSSSTVSVTVFTPPTTADAGADQLLCNVAATTLAGNTITTGTGLWTQVGNTPNIAVISNTASPVSGLTGLIPGVYDFLWTSTNAPCSTSDQVQVTIFALPTVADAGFDRTICYSAPLTLSGNIPVVGSGTWTRISGPTSVTFTNLNSPSSTVLGTIPGTYVFQWTIANGTCTSSSDQVQITIDALADLAQAGPDKTGATTCNLTTLTLAGNNPALGTGQWNIVSGTGGSFANAGLFNSAFNGTAGSSYTLTWTVTNGVCSTTDDILVKFNQLPTTANAGADQIGGSTCGLTSVTLSANTPLVGAGVWSIVSGTGGTVTIPANPLSTFSGTAGNSYTLRWTISNSPCTLSADNVIVTFNRNPTITTAANATNVCFSAGSQTTSIAYTSTTVSPTTYSISWNALPANSFATVTDASLPASPISIAVPAGTAPGTYTGAVTVKNANGCASTGTTFTLTVNTLPAITIAASTAGVCESAVSQTVPLTYSSTTGTPVSYSINWNALPANSFATVANAALPVSPITITVPAGAAAGTYTGTITVKNANGCTSSGTAFTVTVNPKPAITPITTSICSGSTFTYAPVNITDGKVPAGTTYSWSAPTGSGFTGGAASTGTPSSISGTLVNITTGAVTATYTVTPTSGSCTGSNFTLVVTVNSLPAFTNCPVSFTQNTDLNQCTGTSSYTSAVIGTPVPTLTYSYTGATTATGIGSGTGSTLNPGVTNVVITAMSGCGTNDCSFTITVMDKQQPTISCPPDITTSVNNGCTSAAINLGTPVTSDNCSAVSLSNDAPYAFASGVNTVTWTAKDASNNTSTCIQKVTVTNSAPTVIDDSYTVLQSTITSPTTVSGNVLINDTDPEGQSLTVSSWGAPASGTLSTNASGVFTYVPATAFMGSISFSYTMCDACGACISGLVTIVVNPCIAAPIAPVIIRKL